MSRIKRAVQLTSLRNRQEGMASILITMIFIIVISLIVLGFAQISRREQRASLDRQLSTQAFYAAESGVNDVQADIQTALANNQTIPPINNCNTATGDVNGIFNNVSNNATLDQANNTQYTCVLVNPTPTSLIYDPITQEQSKVVRVESNSGNAINQMTFSWQDSTMPSSPTFNCGAGGTSFPPVSGGSNWNANCGAPVLRIDVVPADVASGGGTGWSPLLDTSNMITLFLYPSAGSTTATNVAYNVANDQGKLVTVDCNVAFGTTSPTTPNDCNLVLSNLDRSAYYLRVQSIYNEANFAVNAETVTTTTTTTPPTPPTITDVALGQPVTNPYCPPGSYYYNRPDSNLVDGDTSNYTAQCNYTFYYTVNLSGSNTLSSIEADWGVFGCWPGMDACSNGNYYISSWEIDVSPDNSSWTPVGSGSSPHATSTTLNGPFNNVHFVRVIGSSAYNWIAMSELKAFTTTGGSSGSITTTTSIGPPIALTNGQVVVDSTGKAQDVLRRIQVRLPLNPQDGAAYADNALQTTTSICKQFFVDQFGNKSDSANATSSCSSN